MKKVLSFLVVSLATLSMFATAPKQVATPVAKALPQFQTTKTFAAASKAAPAQKVAATDPRQAKAVPALPSAKADFSKKAAKLPNNMGNFAPAAKKVAPKSVKAGADYTPTDLSYDGFVMGEGYLGAQAMTGYQGAYYLFYYPYPAMQVSWTAADTANNYLVTYSDGTYTYQDTLSYDDVVYGMYDQFYGYNDGNFTWSVTAANSSYSPVASPVNGPAITYHNPYAVDSITVSSADGKNFQIVAHADSLPEAYIAYVISSTNDTIYANYLYSDTLVLTIANQGDYHVDLYPCADSYYYIYYYTYYGPYAAESYYYVADMASKEFNVATSSVLDYQVKNFNVTFDSLTTIMTWTSDANNYIVAIFTDDSTYQFPATKAESASGFRLSMNPGSYYIGIFPLDNSTNQVISNKAFYNENMVVPSPYHVHNTQVEIENGYIANFSWEGNCDLYYLYLLKAGSTTVDSTTIISGYYTYNTSLSWKLDTAGTFAWAVTGYNSSNYAQNDEEFVFGAPITIDSKTFTDAPSDLIIDVLPVAGNQFNATISWTANGTSDNFRYIIFSNHSDTLLMEFTADTFAVVTLDSGFYYVEVVAVDAQDKVYTPAILDGFTCGVNYTIENLSVDNIFIEENNITVSFSWDMENAENNCFGVFVYNAKGSRMTAKMVDSVSAYNCTFSVDVEDWGKFTWGVCVVDTAGAQMSNIVMGDTFTVVNPYTPYELEGDLVEGLTYLFSWSMDSLCSYFWYTITDTAGNEVESTYLDANSYVDNGYGVEFEFTEAGTYTFSVYAGYVDGYYIEALSEEVACQVVVVDPQTALNNVAADVNAQKIFENGQVLIIRDGKVFNTAGAQVR